MEYLKGDYTIITHDSAPLNRSMTGYGSKIPTRYTVKRAFNNPHIPDNRERRVYAICYSNVASHYILIKGERKFIQDSKF